MEFICMDLIGEFHPPTSRGHRYALTVMDMLTGFVFCAPLQTKKAEEIVQKYLDTVYYRFSGRSNQCRRLQKPVPKKKGFLPVPPKSDFFCSPAEVSAHRKVKLQSKPVTEDTIQQFEELCKHFPEVFLKNSEDIGRTNLITVDIDTGDHPPPYAKSHTHLL